MGSYTVHRFVDGWRLLGPDWAEWGTDYPLLAETEEQAKAEARDIVRWLQAVGRLPATAP